MFKNSELVALLEPLDLGSSIAEQDNLLETARVETSAFSDLVSDKVDLIPGTKGSGKTALFRIFVDFLPGFLLDRKKVVVAHGVQKQGDQVFQAFNDEFEKLTEDQFVTFWCIYLTSLAHEHFIKGSRYQHQLQDAKVEIQDFKRACQKANIPDIAADKSLKDILQWTLFVLKKNMPRLTYSLPNDLGELSLDLFGNPHPQRCNKEESESAIPAYADEIKTKLESILLKTNLNIWLMVDRLDEIFPRRTSVERKALRGLLRTMRFFTSDTIRIKIFIRDDMLENLVSAGQGFTALTHITARQADTLRWSEDQILTMVVKRIFANATVSNFFNADKEQLEASLIYRQKLFGYLFPPSVHRGENQSSTMKWLHTRTQDGRGVVTPRDVIDLLLKAKQRQQDILRQDVTGESAYLFSSTSLIYGLEELSKRKRITYLEAEFPHLWKDIKKFDGGKTAYDEKAIAELLGKKWQQITDDLISVGVIKRKGSGDKTVFWFPYIYRKGLNLIQGKA